METRERLAAYAHEAWSDSMLYLFLTTQDNADGTMTIPAWAVQRVLRQMNTPYAELSEAEKADYRVDADKMLAIMAAPAEAGCPRGGDPIACPCGLGIGV